MEEEAKKLCPICNHNELQDGDRVCEDCKSSKPIPFAPTQPAICPDCGEKHDSRIHPTNKMKMCCWSKLMKKGLKAKIKREIEGTEANPNLILSLDFGRMPEVLEQIRNQADEELRTTENHILFCLRGAYRLSKMNKESEHENA